MAVFLLDHCVWRSTVIALRRAGFQCVTLKELGQAEARNGEVIALARQRRSVVITRDTDFIDRTRYPIGSHGGIIYLRITPETAGTVNAMLLQTLRSTKPAHLRGALLIVEPTTSHLRRALR